jgi:stage II sporulation protein M
MMIQKIEQVIKNHIRDNKYTYLSLFIFYIIGILLGAVAVNDLDFQQKDEMTKYFNGFLKLLNSSEVNKISLFKISLLDNLKIIALFWVLGFTVIGVPIYYIVIGMRGFTTGFSSGIIMGVLGSKGIVISTICFLPKEIIVIPCLIALGVNGIRLSRGILKNWLKKSIKGNTGVKQRIGPYSFVTMFYSLFIFFATIIEVFISSGALNILSHIV